MEIFGNLQMQQNKETFCPPGAGEIRSKSPDERLILPLDPVLFQ